jgi:hypothetical protein
MEVNEREEPHESRSEEAIDTPSKKTTPLPPIEYVDYEGEEQLPGASSSSFETALHCHYHAIFIPILC